MTDVEPMLRQAILQGTDSPPPTDLVERVHARARARRRRTAAVTAGLAAASVAAVAVTTAQLAGPDRSGTPSTSESSTPTAIAAEQDWKWESWHDVQVQVPADWVYASRSQWCTMSSRTDGWQVPRVWRSDQPETKVRCSDPVQAYGLSFLDVTNACCVRSTEIWQYDEGGEVPDGAWVALVVERGVGIQITAPDRETVEHIVESVERFRTHADNNGCYRAAGRNQAVAANGPRGGILAVSVCRYADGFWLQQSERLQGADARAAIAALDAAPVIDTVPCPLEKVPPPSIELVTAEGVADIQWNSSCTGVYWKDARRRLTPELMYWALSPGFVGALPDDVPRPSTLRRTGG